MLQTQAKSQQIKHKLILVNMFVVLPVLVIMVGGAAFTEFYTQKRILMDELAFQAEIIAINNTAVLMFEDAGAGREILKVLENSPKIQYAALYTVSGEPLAEYQRYENSFRTFVQPLFNTIQQHNFLMGIYQPVVLDKELLGTVYLEADWSFVKEQVVLRSLIMLLIVLVVFSIMLFVLQRFHRRIMNPLEELIRLMNNVTSAHVYDERAQYQEADELGQLARGFNEMLDKIKSREYALIRHHEQLENTINQRTMRLTEAQRLAHLGSWEWYPIEHRLSWSPELFRILGFQPQQFEPNHEAFMQVVYPADQREVSNFFDVVLLESGEHHLEYRILGSDGVVRYVRQQVESYADQRGRVTHLAGTVQDVSEHRAMLSALQKNEELWSFALEGSGDCVWDWNLQSGRISLSKLSVAMFGFSDKEVANTHYAWYELVHPEDQALWDDMLVHLEQERLQKFTLEYRVRCKDGSYKWIISRGMAVQYDDAGNISRMIGVHTDIDQRKTAEDRLVLFGRIFDASERAISVTDADWYIVYANPAFENLYGYTQQELIDHSLNEFSSPDGEHACAELLTALQHGDNWAGLLPQRRKDGSSFTSASSMGVIRDKQGYPRYYFNILYDYTPEVERQEELRIAKNRADAVSRYKTDFLSNMSHEIRTPMNAIIGLSQLCLQTSLNPKQSDYLAKIHFAAESLLGIVNDILDFSKIEAGKLQIEYVPFDLREIVDNLHVVIENKAAEKELELIFDIRPEAVRQAWLGDPLRLSQVLINLLSNAVKFTEHGYVKLIVDVLQVLEGKSLLHFVVEDTGVGLTQEQITKLFNAFVQADSSTTRKFGGTGLGLSICKRLVELMSGKIWIESVPNQRTKFHFSVELQASTAPVLLRSIPSSSALAGMSVVLCSQDQSLQNLLKDTLVAQACKVMLVASAQGVLRQLPKLKENAVVLVDCAGSVSEQALRTMINEMQQGKAKIVLLAEFNNALAVSLQQEKLIHGMLLKPLAKDGLYQMLQGLVAEIQVGKRGGVALYNADLVVRVAGTHILLVEDNEINQQVAQELLEQAGVKVTIAGHGAEALKILDEQRFDAILMDMQMPVMDGIEATQRIREQSRFADLPIIAMTANAMSIDKERCFAVGMNDHVAKPFKINDLLSVLAKWIRGEKQEQSSYLGAALECEYETEEKEIMSDLPLKDFVNWQELLDEFQGRTAFVNKLLRMLVSSYADLPMQLSEFAYKKDYEELARVSHRFAGAAGQLKAHELFKLAKQVEQAAKGQQPEAVDLTTQLSEKTKAFIAQAQLYIDTVE